MSAKGTRGTPAGSGAGKPWLAGGVAPSPRRDASEGDHQKHEPRSSDPCAVQGGRLRCPADRLCPEAGGGVRLPPLSQRSSARSSTVGVVGAPRPCGPPPARRSRRRPVDTRRRVRPCGYEPASGSPCRGSAGAQSCPRRPHAAPGPCGGRAMCPRAAAGAEYPPRRPCSLVYHECAHKPTSK